MTDLNLHPTTPLHVWVAALRGSHERLATLVSSLTPEQLREQSYDTDWSIAQVLSHLGSGADAFSLRLQAGLDGGANPDNEVMQPIWEQWDAKTPEDQARESLESSAAYFAAFDALDDRQREDWQLDFYGTTIDLRELTRLYLAEHSVHSWDAAVAFDAHALVASDAVELLIDTLGQLVKWVGKPLDHQLVVAVETEQPSRNLVITVNADGATLKPLDARSEADDLLLLPAEAFLRLLYGRLDPGHTPSGVDDEILGVLRSVFRGV